MALLEKRITKNIKKDGSEKVKPRESQKVYINIGIESSSNEIDRFAVSVIKKLIDDSVPPTPDNYRIYFEKQLSKKNIEFQKKIQELLEYEESNYNEDRVEIEKDVREVFANINSTIKIIGAIYKNIQNVKQFCSEIQRGITDIEDSFIIKSQVENLNSKLTEFEVGIDKQISFLKEQYQNIGKSFKNAESSTIFDTRFGVYNKRYFLKQTKIEIEKVAKFNYNSCLMSIYVSDEVLQKLPYQKDKIFLLRAVAKMLLKTSRRNDIIAYLGENSFTMLLRHTDLQSAKRAAQRIYDLLINANIILNSKEITVKTGIAIAKLTKDKEAEEIIGCVLNTMKEAEKSNEIYKICE